MAINVNLAPFINKEFLVTGAWGEQRPRTYTCGYRFTNT